MSLERTFVKTMSIKMMSLKRMSYPISKSMSVAAELHVVEPLFLYYQTYVGLKKTYMRTEICLVMQNNQQFQILPSSFIWDRLFLINFLYGKQ